jgi:hypothetical protein
MPGDASYVDRNAAVMEYQEGSEMCKAIQLTGISMFIIIIITIMIINYGCVTLPRASAPLPLRMLLYPRHCTGSYYTAHSPLPYPCGGQFHDGMYLDYEDENKPVWPT